MNWMVILFLSWAKRLHNLWSYSAARVLQGLFYDDAVLLGLSQQGFFLQIVWFVWFNQ
jgi:hypothetical protein